jgi:hypothetical protein
MKIYYTNDIEKPCQYLISSNFSLGVFTPHTSHNLLYKPQTNFL